MGPFGPGWFILINVPAEIKAQELGAGSGGYDRLRDEDEEILMIIKEFVEQL